MVGRGGAGRAEQGGEMVAESAPESLTEVSSGKGEKTKGKLKSQAFLLNSTHYSNQQSLTLRRLPQSLRIQWLPFWVALSLTVALGLRTGLLVSYIFKCIGYILHYN